MGLLENITGGTLEAVLITAVIGIAGGLLLAWKTVRRCWKSPLTGGQRTLQYQAGTKVVPLHNEWLKTPAVQGDASEEGVFPRRGNVYVVRTARIMPDGNVALQLIGVTLSKPGETFEPLWEAGSFRTLAELQQKARSTII